MIILFKILGVLICFDFFLVVFIKLLEKIKLRLFIFKHRKYYKKTYFYGLQINVFAKEELSILEYFYDLPKKLVYSFTRHKYKVTLLSRDLFYTYAKLCGRGDDCVAFFAPYRKEIVLNLDNPFFREALFHEFGHFCDYLRGGLHGYASHVDFDVEEERKEQFFNSHFFDYYVENNTEFVAFCVSEYLCKHLISERMVQIAKKYLQVSFDDAYLRT